jgi:hypothetical protein
MGSTLDKIPQMGRAQSSRSRTHEVCGCSGGVVLWWCVVQRISSVGSRRERGYLFQESHGLCTRLVVLMFI